MKPSGNRTQKKGPTVALKGRRVVAQNRRLAVGCDLEAGSFSFVWKEKKGIALDGAAPSIRIGQQWRALSGTAMEEYKHKTFRDKDGRGVELSFRYSSRPGIPEARLLLRLRGDEPSVLLKLMLKNQDDKPIRIGKVNVLSIDRNAGGSIALGASTADAKVYLESNNLCWTGVKSLFDTPAAGARGGVHESAGVGLIWNPNPGVSFLGGFVTADIALTRIVTSVRQPVGVVGWQATCSYDDLEIPPGGELSVEELRLELSRDPFASLERYGRAFACRYGVAPAKTIPHLWCSWYSHRLTVDEKAVLDNARIIADRYRRYGVDTLQIDYGWNWRDTPAEWGAHAERFPHGMRWLVERLREMDLKLGLWAAPFYVGEQSRLYKEHPEVLLRDPATGKPVKYGWEWGSQPRETWQAVYLMDTTHPSSQQWLKKTFAEMASWGVRYFKLDFLDGGSQAPLSFSNAKNPQSAYRRRDGEQMRKGLSAIREAVGKDAYLLGCNLPIMSGIGIMSAVFTAMDIGNAVGSFAHLKSRLTTVIARWYQQNVLWLNDPDVISLSGKFLERGSVCSMGEARIRCTASALSGGPLLLGDDLPSLPEDRLEMYTVCLPAYGKTARPVDLFTADHARIWDREVACGWGTWHVVGLFNYDAAESTIPVSFKDLGIEGEHEYLVWEFWDQELLGSYRKGLRVKVGKETARTLVIRKKETRPAVLSTSFHLSQGACELSDVRWNPAGAALTGTVTRHPGARGSIFLHVAPSGRKVKEVQASGARAAGRALGGSVYAVDLELEKDKADFTVKFTKG